MTDVLLVTLLTLLGLAVTLGMTAYMMWEITNPVRKAQAEKERRRAREAYRRCVVAATTELQEAPELPDDEYNKLRTNAK